MSFSCEKDDSYTQDNNVVSQPKEKGYTVRKVTLNEVKANSIIKNSLDNIENQFDFNKLKTSKKNKNTSNTSTSAVASNGPINSKDNTFTIVTDEILQVSTDSTDVYTFRIETPTKPESDFENFVIHKSSDGSIAYFIYSYKNYNDDFTALNVSRKKVSEDQINIGDFDDYIPSYKEYDPGSDCWIEVTMDQGELVITFSDCGNGGPGGGDGGDGGGWSGGSGASDGSSAYSYSSNGDGTCNYYYMVTGPLGFPVQEIERNVPCPSSSNSSGGSDSSSGGDSTDPWGNSSDTWSNNNDPLHDGNNTGGGTSPSNGSDADGTNPNDGDVIAILPPSQLERETNAFFDNLTDEQKDCLNRPFNQLEGQITTFFEANQTIAKPSLDGAIFDGAVIDNSIKDFANAAIDAHCSGGGVDFDLKIAFEITETLAFKDKTCLKKIKDDVIKTKQISKIIKKFKPTYPVLHLEWDIFQNTNWRNTGRTSLNQPEQNTAFIDINSESLSHVSNIVMVQTIAHEIIHAELLRKLKELVDDFGILTLAEYNALQDNYPGIADYVFDYGVLEYSQTLGGTLVSWSLAPNYTQAHHNQMGDFYRVTLIDVMKSYDEQHNITRENADEFYEALSWAGLRAFSTDGISTEYYDAWKKFKAKIDIDEASVPVADRTYNRYTSIIEQEYNNVGVNCN